MLPQNYQTREQLPSIWMCYQWQWEHNCSYYYNVTVPTSQCGEEQTACLGLLALKAGSRPGGNVVGEAPNLEEIIRREASLSGCEILYKLKKCLFQIFLGQLDGKHQWRRRQPGVERLLVERIEVLSQNFNGSFSSAQVTTNKGNNLLINKKNNSRH